ncbi:axonemal 84 kDa protein-like, partial [Argonauta hians]
EKKQRVGELKEFDKLLVDQERTLFEALMERRRQEKWERYMRCDGTPDPSIQQEINTYISMCQDDDTSDNNIDIVLNNTVINLNLIEELKKYVVLENLTEPMPERRIKIYETINRDLQNLINMKLNTAIHGCLLKALLEIDPETSNYQSYYSNEVVSVCIWGNLCKNLRIKSYEFKEFGFMFDIPKVIALADCAVALLYTNFDHLSETSDTSISHRKGAPIVLPSIIERYELKMQQEEAAAAAAAAAAAQQAEEEHAAEPPSTDDFFTLLMAPKLEETLIEKKEKPKKSHDEIIIDYEFPPSPEPLDFDEFEGDKDTVDLRCFQVLGGIFHISLLNLPPQPKTCGKWTLTEVVDIQMSHIEYTADPPIVEIKENSEEFDQKKEPSGEQKRDERPLICISLRVPPRVVLGECPHPVKWNSQRKLWTVKDLTEYKYNEETKTVQFKTNSFGIFAFIQDIHINMPFQSWELRPQNANSAILNITAAIIDVSIEIKGGVCCLMKQNEEGAQHLENQWFEPMELLKRLTACGINLYPSDDSVNYVSTQNKSYILEMHCYEQMAVVSGCMMFAWSRWNGASDRNQMIIQACETVPDTMTDDLDMYMVTKTRVKRLKLDEFDEEFSEEAHDDYKYYSNFYHLLKGRQSEPILDRLNALTPEFRDCVKKLLCATRILIYS